MTIYEYIPTGSKNAIKRRDLADLIGETDRGTRALVAKAAEDLPIINFGTGYFIPDINDPHDVAILRGVLLRENARIESLIKRRQTLYKWAQKADEVAK